jgi:hypothetical protein
MRRQTHGSPVPLRFSTKIADPKAFMITESSRTAPASIQIQPPEARLPSGLLA